MTDERRPSFDRFLDGLVRLIEKETGKPAKEGARARVSAAVLGVKDNFDYAYDDSDLEPFEPDLHEIKEPLTRVIELLERDDSRPQVFRALGAPREDQSQPEFRWTDHHQAALEKAVDRYYGLLDDLRSVAREAPEPPPKRGRGRTSVTRDLYEAVSSLADTWERETDREFKPLVDRGGPAWTAANPGTGFVVDAMGWIDARRHDQLIKVMERVRSDRLRDSGK